ncbi:protein-L-isoaspartate(D-aspartate) O-methyltransferase [Limibacillus sp. MBR-115]
MCGLCRACKEGVLRSAAFSQRRGEREALLAEIEGDVRETARQTGLSRLPDVVRTAIACVPRHCFVRPSDNAHAYENRALPIDHGQTISQPYIVAVMTALCGAGPGKRILEIGTGCGYQAAVLAETGAVVYSIEVVPPLARSAAQTLEALGYGSPDVVLREGDGRQGWPEAAPFDAILVAAAAERMPSALGEQLAVGGTLVFPMGPANPRRPFPSGQTLCAVDKQSDGSFRTRKLIPVAFVPLVAPGRIS